MYTQVHDPANHQTRFHGAGFQAHSMMFGCGFTGLAQELRSVAWMAQYIQAQQRTSHLDGDAYAQWPCVLV
jgi:hypothetical protein